MKLKQRFSEPSTWAGVGLVIQGAIQAYAAGGSDPVAWATIAAGMGAIIRPEGVPVRPMMDQPGENQRRRRRA